MILRQSITARPQTADESGKFSVEALRVSVHILVGRTLVSTATAQARSSLFLPFATRFLLALPVFCVSQSASHILVVVLGSDALLSRSRGALELKRWYYSNLKFVQILGEADMPLNECCRAPWKGAYFGGSVRAPRARMILE